MLNELMSLEVGAVSSSKKMGEKSGDEKEGTIKRSASDSSLASMSAAEEEEEESKIQLGPQCSLKEQLEKDKVGLFHI